MKTQSGEHLLVRKALAGRSQLPLLYVLETAWLDGGGGGASPLPAPLSEPPCPPGPPGGCPGLMRSKICCCASVNTARMLACEASIRVRACSRPAASSVPPCRSASICSWRFSRSGRMDACCSVVKPRARVRCCNSCVGDGGPPRGGPPCACVPSGCAELPCWAGAPLTHSQTTKLKTRVVTILRASLRIKRHHLN